MILLDFMSLKPKMKPHLLSAIFNDLISLNRTPKVSMIYGDPNLHSGKYRALQNRPMLLKLVLMGFGSY